MIHEKFLKRHGVSSEQLTARRTERSPTAEKISTTGFANKDIPLSNSAGGNAFKKEPNKYTGNVVIGIGQMHKSNAIPITNRKAAIEIAKMRRG